MFSATRSPGLEEANGHAAEAESTNHDYGAAHIEWVAASEMSAERTVGMAGEEIYFRLPSNFSKDQAAQEGGTLKRNRRVLSLDDLKVELAGIG
jgi:hypothetical protein